jgi:signal peptidase I
MVMREYTESLVVAVILALVLRFFVISAYKIPTSSMVPTLKVGDFIFAYKLPYGVPIPFAGGDRWIAQMPERGDVVVFRYPGHETIHYVKRVVGLPGDRIAIKNKKLYVNDVEVDSKEDTKTAINDLPGNEYYSVFRETMSNHPHLIIHNNDEDAGSFGPIVVPPQQIFVLGDNRDSSDDSRYWGTVPFKNLEGRVVMVWMSFDWLNRWGNERLPTVRWDRVFSAIR